MIVVFQFVIVVFPDHTHLLCDVSVVNSVKQMLFGKECDKALLVFS